MKMKSKIMKTLALLIISCMLLPVFSIYVTAEEYGVVLECSDRIHYVAPDNATTFKIIVTNTGDSADTIILTANNVPNLSSTFLPQKISLNANESSTAYLFVVVSPDVQGGSYEIYGMGKSENNTDIWNVISLTVMVESYNFEIETEKTIMVAQGQSAESIVKISSAGVCRDTINLTVEPSDLAEIDEESVTLNPGETKNITLYLFASFEAECKKHTVYLNSTSLHGAANKTTIILRIVHPTSILLVNDCDETSIQESLNSTFYYYDAFNVDLNGPNVNVMEKYDVVIWDTGKERRNTLTVSDQENIIEYLNNGGALWLIGRDILYDIGLNDFVKNYLHIVSAEQDKGLTNIAGVENDPITDGLNYDISDPKADSIIPDNDSFGIFYGKNNYSALRYSGVYNTVFFAFDFSGIQNENDRNKIVNSVVSWFLEEKELLTCINNVSRIAPGNSTDYIVTVKNNYDYGGLINFTVDIPLRWEASFNESITIGAKETKNLTLTVACPFNAVMGDYIIRFSGKSQNGVTDCILLVARVSLPVSVLLVNDCENSFENILNSTFYYYDVFKFVDLNGPNMSVMEKYGLVIWNTGMEWENTLTFSDQENISMYLENGGALWLIGQDILHDIYNNSNDFVKNYLHVDSADQDVGIPSPLVGMNPVFDNVDYLTNTSSEDYTDSLTPDNDSFGVFYGKNNYSAIGYSGVYRVVFFAFDFSFIQNEDDKNEIIETVLGWLSEKKP
ncbi:MAG: hypothetical protein L6265_11620, partial [Thermoplasmatales archaeon]|nr:hypothetical protein [Thermoplasmatales archaeon]